MKLNKICMTCQLLHTCEMTRVTEQCPIFKTKPADNPFDKEFGRWVDKDTQWRKYGR